MPSNDLTIEELEDIFPLLAEAGSKQASDDASAAGLTVRQSIDGVLYEVFPDGTRKFVKTLKPPVPILLGASVPSSQPRVRMFAGPNGSGKTTLKSVLPSSLVGHYINPDEIEKEIASNGLNLSSYRIDSSVGEWIKFFGQSTLLAKADLRIGSEHISISGNTLSFNSIEINSYLASVVADFIRQKQIAAHHSFTFETVMSSQDKIEFLHTARRQGYRTYLYYIATDDPEINISRVHSRVKKGGHSVPDDKIVSRYWKSLDLLIDAIRNSDRALIFDNSYHCKCLAEITSGRELKMKTTSMPAWFKESVWDKMPAENQNNAAG